MRKRILLIGVLLLVLCSPALAQSNRTFIASTSSYVQGTTFTWEPLITGKISISAFTLHFTTPTDESIIIYLDASQGASYDTVIASSGTAVKSDYFWQPDLNFILERADSVRVTVGSGAGAEPFAMTLRGDLL